MLALWFIYRTSQLAEKVVFMIWSCSGAGICLYVDHLLSESSEEVRKLRGYMYAYKAS